MSCSCDERDTIIVKDIEAQGIVGIHAEERVNRQLIRVNLRIYTDIRKCGASDNLGHSINYATCGLLVVKLLETSSFLTVEALASTIARELVLTIGVPKVTVRVDKPEALRPYAASAAVQITRSLEHWEGFLMADGAENQNIPSLDVSPKGRSALEPRSPLLSARSVATSTGAVVGDVEDPIAEAVVFLALGSNLGRRAHNIQAAITQLKRDGVVTVEKTSHLYETPAAYVEDQPPFLNCAIGATTTLAPLELLEAIKKVEVDQGREATVRWGPRAIDIDILLFGDVNMQTETLTIPHERMAERDFVLGPLCDIAADVSVPSRGTVRELLAALPKVALQRVLPLIGDKEETMWKINERTHFMGILNVTPDSFSDGGKFDTVAPAVEQARSLLDGGADIIDIGGQSTAPNAPEVGEEEEIARVVPVIKALRAAGIAAPISVDTFRARVARAAVVAGANMINDVSAGERDQEMITTAAELQASYTLTQTSA